MQSGARHCLFTGQGQHNHVLPRDVLAEERVAVVRGSAAHRHCARAAGLMRRGE